MSIASSSKTRLSSTAVAAEQSEDERLRKDIKMRSAIGVGNSMVDLSDALLLDEDVRTLVRLLTDAELAAESRLREASVAMDAADKEKFRMETTDYDPFAPTHLETDRKEHEWREACNVVWPDDPIVFDPQAAEAADAVADELPSYRFTPRSQRKASSEYDHQNKTKTVHSKGRARILFRSAWARHTMRQKALLADAARAKVAYDEGGCGCRHLSLCGNRIGSRGTAHLAALMRSSKMLETLVLGGNAIGDAGAALLGRALQTSKALRTLALQSCAIGAKGVRHLSAGLTHNRSLRALWLLGNAASDEGVAHLAGALRSCKLESLGLEKNGIGARGCEALALALVAEQCPLLWLRLQHNPLGDAGVSVLAHALHHNRSLTKLQLRDTAVGVAGCTALGDAVRVHGTLRSLSLEENGLPTGATEQLLRAMKASASLATLDLDLGHGGSYDQPHDRDELASQLTLTFLGLGGGGGKLARASATSG